MAVDPRIVAALRNLDPGRPPAADQYVARDLPTVTRGWNVAERIETLLLAGTHLRALLHGCTGVGKSSEIARWTRLLSGVALVVPVVATQATGAHLQHAVTTALVQTIQGLGRWEDIPEALAKWAVSPPVPGITPLYELCAWCESTLGLPVLVLVDGSDLYSAKDASRVFGPGGMWMSREFPPMVCTVPHDWALETGPGARDERIEAVWHLPPFPVVQEDGSPNDTVIAALVEGLRQRLGDPDLFEDPELLYRIVRSSGGVPRHAVILLRQSLLAAAGGAQVRASHVLEAERELRQDLRHSLAPDFATGGWADSPVTAGMRVSGAVLSYEGRERRFDALHPLLRE